MTMAMCNLKQLTLLIILVCLGFPSLSFGEITITTDFGSGADTFVVSIPSLADDGTSEIIIIKNDSGTGRLHRKGYFRFDLSSVDTAIDEASFILTYAGVAYTARHAIPSTFNVFGLNDGHPGEMWNESEINWGNAPANSTGSGSQLIQSDSTFLGTFDLDITTLAPGNTISFNNSELRDFLRLDTNNLVTLVISRQNRNLENEWFAAKEHCLYAAPSLVVAASDDLPVRPDNIQASEPLNIIYVDDNAVNDPGPNEVAMSDLLEDGTNEHPFDMIQEGIDAACVGATVLVREGTYYETIQFRGRNIHVTSFDSNLGDPHNYPVIDAGYSGTVVSFNQNEGPNCTLSGFVLTRGFGEAPSSPSSNTAFGPAAAIACLNSSPTVSNCVIVGNRCPDPVRSSAPGGVVYCVSSSIIFENCTIVDNYGGAGGAGMYFLLSEPIVLNSIIRGNAPEQIAVVSGADPIVVYSNVQGTWPGVGNTDVDPNFADPGYWANSEEAKLPITHPSDPAAIWIGGDYHLASWSGRWDPLSKAWLQDQYTSRSIDAGDPASRWENEPSPRGEQINQGAYGGTLQASKTSLDCTLTIESKAGGSVTEPSWAGLGEKQFEYACGTDVKITIVPDEYHHVLRWMIDSNTVPVSPPSPNPTSTAVTLNSNMTVSPIYRENNLDLEAGPGGTAAFLGGTPPMFSRNVPVNVMATPKPCYRFTHWSGNAFESGRVTVAEANPAAATVQVDLDYKLTAHFALDESKYKLDRSSTLGGSVITPGEEGLLEEPLYDCGTEVTVVAVPDKCQHFTGWTGTAVEGRPDLDPNDPNDRITVLMDGNYTLKANFEFDDSRRTLTVSSDEGGHVEPGEEDLQYECGRWVNVFAIPEYCYHFHHWSGTAVEAGKVKAPNNLKTSVLMDADYTLMANFEFGGNEVYITSTEGGHVERGFEDVIYPCFKIVPVVAIPDEPCFRFVKWTGTAADDVNRVWDVNDPDISVTVDRFLALTAHFERIQYNLTISSTDGGYVRSPGEGPSPFINDCNDLVPIVAIHDPKYHFVEWTGTAAEYGAVTNPFVASTEVLIEADDTLKAIFELDP